MLKILIGVRFVPTYRDFIGTSHLAQGIICLISTRMFSHDVDIGSRILCCAQGSFIMKLHVLKCLDIHVSLEISHVKLLILGLRIEVNNFGNVKFL